MFRALLVVICAGHRRWRWPAGGVWGWSRAAGSAGFRAVSGIMGGNYVRQASGGAAVTVRFSVTVRQVREDGSEVPADGEVAAALAGPAEQFAGLAAWAADEARFLDHGEREEVIGAEGRELQRRLLQATFDDRRRPRGARRAGHQRRGDPARQRGGRARPGRDQRVRAGPGHPDGLPQPPRAEPVPRRRPVGPARGPVLPGHARPGGLSPGRERVRAGPGGDRGPYRGHGRPRPAHRPRRRTSPPGRTTSTRSAPATRKKKTCRAAT